MSRRSLQSTPNASENVVLSSLERLSGLETAAAGILKQAVEMDNAKRFLEALTCYREGLGFLLDVVRNTTDETRKQKFRVRIEEYMNRAEKLKILIEREKKAGRFHEQFRIPDNGVGYSYERLMKPLLDDEVTHIDVEDAYIRTHFQILNFVRFCELVCKHATNLKSMALTTGQAQDEGKDGKQQQETALESLTKSLQVSRGVLLTVHYSSTLHDREIRFNNGWVIKIGRGLDYFKPVQKYALGSCDMDLRPCHETTVDIYHRASTGGQQDQNLQRSASEKATKPKVRFA